MTISQIQNLTATEMQAVNSIIMQRLKSDVVLINQLGLYIISAGGKRLRPLLAVLSAKALGYEGSAHHLLATIVEFIHTATLLHDDVVDDSKLRRGRETANQLFGNEASVLVGDYLYTRAFQMMTELGDDNILQIFADTTNIIAEGEVMQLMNVNNSELSEERYFEVINAKTAELFAATTRIAAIVSGVNKEQQQSFSDYGKYLGQAFQLADDALDYQADADEMGKNTGDDLAEGKATLPLIHALQQASSSQKELLQLAIKEGRLDKLEEVKNIIDQTGAIEYTLDKARSISTKAKESISFLQDSEYKNALISLCDFAVQRTH